jgi:replicative DNA helicase
MAFQKKRDRLGAERNFDNGSKSAEYAVIGCMLKLGQDFSLWDSVEEEFGLKDVHFFDDLMCAAYRSGVALATSGQTVDYVSLTAEICDRTGRLAEDVEEELNLAIKHAGDTEYSAAGVAGWVKIVISKYQDRRLAMAGSIVQEMPASDDGRTKQEIIAEAMERLTEAAEAVNGRGTPIKSAKQIMTAALEEIRYAKEIGTGLTGISTGFTDLDALTQGFKPQELIVLAARPSMGKTAAALSMMHHIAEKQKKHVYFVSLEMGEGQIGMRYFALRTGITIHKMRTGGVSTQEEKMLEKAVADQHDVGFFHFDESPAMTAQQICSRARKQHAKFADEGGLGMLVVDYIGIVTEVGRANDSKADRIGEITRSLKQLSRELKIPVVALAQLNRKVEGRQDRRPMMSDLRDSGSIEQDADVIMFLYRDEVYNPESIDKGIAEIILVKQRNGSLGTVRVAFDGPRAEFKDIGAPSIAQPKTMTMHDFELPMV